MGKVFQPGMMGKVVGCDYVKVRKKVGSEYVVESGNKLKVGTIVELLGYDPSAGRYKIDYKSKDGYIYKDYVELL
jgi:Bacterial SH3 domain.